MDMVKLKGLKQTRGYRGRPISINRQIAWGCHAFRSRGLMSYFTMIWLFDNALLQRQEKLPSNKVLFLNSLPEHVR